MSVHIPSEVVFFLNVVGIPYPDVDVDQVRELADSTREFAADIRGTFDATTHTLDAMGTAMSGYSYQAILVGWSHYYGKMAELDTAFGAAATALDIAADVIEAIQIAVLIELAALAASFIAGMFTPAAPVTGPMITAAARHITKEMAEAIMWYIATEVVIKAVEPLVEKFDRFVREALKPPEIPLPISDSGSRQFHLDPDEVERYSRLLDGHSDELLSHADKFSEKLDRLDFTTPRLGVEPADWPTPSDVPAPADSTPSSMPPESSLVQQPPTAGAYPGNAQENDPFMSGDSRAETADDPSTARNVDPSGAAASTPDPSRPDAASPTTAAGAAPGGAPSSVGGVPSSGTDRHGQDGNTGDRRTIGTENMGYNAARGGAEPAHRQAGEPAHHQAGEPAHHQVGEPVHHQVGEIAGVVPPGTVQATPSASDRPSQVGPASQGQRPADAAAGKTQGGAGRAAGSAGSDARRPVAGSATKTPWSRAGRKATGVGSTAKRPDANAPTTPVRGATDNGEATQTTPAASGGPQQTVPQVFAPNTAAPPPSEASNGTGTEGDRADKAQPSSKEIVDAPAADPRLPTR